MLLTPFLAVAAAEVVLVHVNSTADVEEAILGAKGRNVLLRIRADWDISDPELDKVYESPCVRELLSGMTLLLADITADTGSHRELLKHYQVYGPPWVILFDGDGRRVPDGDILGYMSAYQLAEKVREALDLEQMPRSCRPDN